MEELLKRSKERIEKVLKPVDQELLQLSAEATRQKATQEDVHRVGFVVRHRSVERLVC